MDIILKMDKTRTAGDGMESVDSSTETAQRLDTRNGKNNKVEAVVPGRLVQLYPSNVFKTDKKSQIRAKSPKFVPYEPYPAAVKPILPTAASKEVKKSRNNMDINTLISQMSQMNTNLNEFKPRTKPTSASEKTNKDMVSMPDNSEIVSKVHELSVENEILKEQLKQQVQVNKELKTMLVASMGEDLEIQVQSLNDDKKHLANALLSSAQHLSTHQEQTEWLAGQCEVWRSKFLASSLMVEELANWKKVLSDQTEKLQQAIKQLMDERCRTREMMMYTYRNLYSLHEKWLEDLAISESIGNNKMYNRPIGSLNLTASMPHSTNIVDLASVNLKLSENISSSVEKQDISQLNHLPTVSDAEKNAEDIMASPLEMKKISEEPVNALVHHAYNSSGANVRPIASCVHCNGKVQLL